MQTTTDFSVEYPPVDDELGLTLDTLGKFVIVSQASAQSEAYGIKFEDRIIGIKGVNCIGKSPNEVVGLIRKFHGKNLVIKYQRSFKPEEMDDLNKSITAPLQNDSVFYEGTFLMRQGFSSNQPFQEKVIRIVRITGPLLPYSSKFSLIPFGISMIWYNGTSVDTIPYGTVPNGAQNLLPCLLEVRRGTNGYFILSFSCEKEILLTVCQEKERIMEFIDVLSYISFRDVSPLIKAIGSSNQNQTTDMAIHNRENLGDTDTAPVLDFGEVDNKLTNRNLRSTLNIPYPYKIMPFVQMIYEDHLTDGLIGLLQNCLCCGTGFHPEQITHSVTAMLIHAKQFIPDARWDTDVQKRVQDIIVEIAKHNADYIRTTSAHPTGFYVFNGGDASINGPYIVTKELFDDIPVFLSASGSRLFRQIHQDHSTWILQKSNSSTAAYYIHSSDIIPPRYGWVAPSNIGLPAPIVQAICDML